MMKAAKRGLLVGILMVAILCPMVFASEWFEDNLKVVGNDSQGTAPDNTQQFADLTLDNSGNVLAVWEDQRHAGEDDNIFFSKYSGSSFSTNLRVDDQSGADTISEQPKIAASADGQTVYVVWQDDRQGIGQWDVYLARSLDSGTTFYSTGNPNRAVASGANNQKEPDIEVNSTASVIHLCWLDTSDWKLVYCRETNIDADTPFGNTVEVDDVSINIQGDEDSMADLAVDNNGLAYVVWRDDRSDSDGDIYFAKNSTSGGAFSAAAKVHPDNGFTQEHAQISVSSDGSRIYVVWDDNRSGNWDVYFCYSIDGGTTFSAPKAVHEVSTNNQQYPSLTLDDSGNIHVAWQDGRNSAGDPDIYYTRSVDGGENFLISKRVDRISSSDVATSGDQLNPAMAVSGQGDVHVAWTDERNTGSGDPWDIYFSRLRPGKPTTGDLDSARYLSVMGLLDTDSSNAELNPVPVTSQLYAFMNRPLNDDYVNASTVQVKKRGNSGLYDISVPGTVHYLEGSALELELNSSSITSQYAIIFDPSGNLSPGADYRMTLVSKKAGTLDGLQDMEGNGFADGGDKVFDFSIRIQDSYTISNVFNYPNPSSDGTTYIRYTLGFDLDSSDRQWIKIYNADGRLVRKLDSGTETSASSHVYEAEWDGTMDDGREVVNGLYLYRVIVQDSETGNSVERVGKAVIAR